MSAYTQDTYPEIADELSLTLNYDDEDGSTIGLPALDIGVGFGAGANPRVVADLGVDIGGREDVRMILSPEQAFRFGNALVEAAFEAYQEE